MTPRSLVAFAASGLIGSLLARYLYYASISRIGSSRTEPLKSTFPLVALTGAFVFLGERVSPVVSAGVVLLVIGAVVVAHEARFSDVTSSGRGFWFDLSLPLLAAVLLGVDPLFTKTGLAEGTPAIVGVTVRVTAAAAGFTSYLGWRRARGGVTGFTVDRWVLAAGLANTVYLLSYFLALDHAPVSVVTAVLGSSTLLVVLASRTTLQSRERVTPELVAGAAVVVAGVLLVVRG